MVTGFKKDGVFHPITKGRGVSKNSRVRYANDTGSSQEINQGVKAFARKVKQRHDQFKANQKENFNRELETRRKFEGKLIEAFRQGRAQGVNNSRKMEKFIRQAIPDLPDDKQTNKFVVRVLKDFIDREKELERRKKGKSDIDKEELQEEFEKSLKDSRALFETLQAKQDTEFAKETAKIIKEKEKESKKFEQERDDAIKKQKEAEEKARNTAKDPNATTEEKNKAEQQAQQTEKEAEKTEEKQQDFAQEVLDELQKVETSVQSEDVGFPSEII